MRCAVRGTENLLTIALLSWVGCAAATETYHEYVLRGIESPSPALANALAAAGVAAMQPDDVKALSAANAAFLDASYEQYEASTEHPIQASLDARVAVPLLVQLVREWSAHGHSQRAQAFAPIVEAVRRLLAGVSAPRVLVPGSGLGRLLHDLGDALKTSSPTIVGVEPDIHAQLLAGRLLEPVEEAQAPDDSSCRDEAASETLLTHRDGMQVPYGCSRNVAAIYPSLHLSTGWANATDRLAPILLPDVTAASRAEVQQLAAVQLVVGSFPDALEPLGGADGGGGDGGGGGGEASGFDAVATCFFLDVARDILSVIRAVHTLLAPRQGSWANLGPLAFPDAPHEAMGGANLAYPLSASQLLGLVRAGGFEITEERLAACEYGGLPRRLERPAERTCLYFVAKAVAV